MRLFFGKNPALHILDTPKGRRNKGAQGCIGLRSIFKSIKYSLPTDQIFALLNDGAKRNRLLYLKIMYTEVKKILSLPKFFAFFAYLL